MIKDTHREYMRSFTILMIENLVKEMTFFSAYHDTIGRLNKLAIFKEAQNLSIKWVNGSLSNSIEKLFDRTLYYNKQKFLHKGII